MQQTSKRHYLFSASDLVHFLACQHSTVLDLRNFSEQLEIAEESVVNQLLQAKGHEHEVNYLNKLKNEGKSVIEIPKKESLSERVRLTKEALNSAVDVIYHGTLYTNYTESKTEGESWSGEADFLVKVDHPSKLGNFSFEAIDTKLAKHTEPKHIIQLCSYSDLLANIQGVIPQQMHLVLGDGALASFKVSDFSYYYTHAKRRFVAFINEQTHNSYPLPCQFCSFCRWQEFCHNKWQQDNHLSLVAGIKSSQIDKLNSSGIYTVKELANLINNAKIAGISQDVINRLSAQASLQSHKLTTGEDKFAILPLQQERGFNRLPLPIKGDLFFDMEGDPLYPNGLEYLFGIYYLPNNASDYVFKAFWAHDHEQERETLRCFIEFLSNHLAANPNAYIYHYNHYETTALKRLTSRYAIGEEHLDNLLRKQKFVDLYKVVREGIRISEPSYSIKNLEVFYMGKRNSAVATAGDSIVVYNQWREIQDDKLLEQIAECNEIDCISTQKLRDWLLTLKPSDCAWFNQEERSDDGCQGGGEPLVRHSERKDWEIEYEDYRNRLSEVIIDKQDDKILQSHIVDLLEFHNREGKPQWWALFDRKDKDEDELIDDTECLGALNLIGQPEPEKRSLIYSYNFPAQEYKLRSGDMVINAQSMETIGSIIEIDDSSGLVRIKRGVDKEPLLSKLSISSGGPISTDGIRAAIYRVADSIIQNEAEIKYMAIADILNKSIPRIKGIEAGSDIVPNISLQNISKVISNLDNSYLFVQGPPGSGKTYTSAHVIAHLLENGKKVGIAANSHKAIHNLLDKIEEVAKEKSLRFNGIKKSSTGIETIYEGNCIRSQANGKNINLNTTQLLAGTSWLFANERFDNYLDYLFIEEAGQVSLANVVAMSTASRNIILVGDQMQLGGPIQGVHPGEAGKSILEFLLGNDSTIPADRGIFLSHTRRLTPSICKFISDAFYDSRLNVEPNSNKRQLLFEASFSIAAEGIKFLATTHSGCSQKSIEEGE